MKTYTRTIGLLLLLSTWAMADTQEQVNTFIEAWQQTIQTQNMEAAIDLIHPDVSKAAIAGPKSVLQHRFAGYATAAPKIMLREFTQSEHGTMVQATVTLEPSGQPLSEKHMLYALKAHDDRLMLWTLFEQAGPEIFNPHTRVVTSRKGQFTFTVPPNWYAAKPEGPIAAISAGSAVLVGPDMESTFAMGVVQLPMKIADTDLETAKIAAQSDVAATKRLTQGHQILTQGPVVIDGRDAYMIQAQFKLEASDKTPRLRTRYYIHKKPMIYFFVCDTSGVGDEDSARQGFEAIMDGFKLMPQAQGVSLQETMAAQQGEGSVTGRVYTAESFNCFIAAPDGWSIRTSSNPAHLVEMQINEGKSIARLIGQKGLPDTLSLQDLVTGRAESVQKVVQAYQSVSSRTMAFQGQEAIEEVCTFTIEGFAAFQEKSISLIRDNTCYIILCQCIEPDDYATLEADFAEIIESFGFIQ
ncbi:MAG: hypothetical protein GY809_09990 [Planctomycetes bacterium]|nr:hypothetical protein [Planctomycetota bacterium]